MLWMPVKKKKTRKNTHKKGSKEAIETRLSKWLWAMMAKHGSRYKRKDLARDLGIKRLNRITELLDEGKMPSDHEVARLAVWANASSIFIYSLMDKHPPAWYNEEMEKLNRFAYRLTEPNIKLLLKEASKLYGTQREEKPEKDHDL